MTRYELRRRIATLMLLSREQRRQTLRALPQSASRAIAQEWWWGVHGGQVEPESAWRIWAIVAGRGFGKTRAGAEWVWARVREAGTVVGQSPHCPSDSRGTVTSLSPGQSSDCPLRIALVAASLDEVAKVMVEGESGLLATARAGEEPRWISSRGILLFPSGAAAFAYTAERPGKLRGPQHHYAWCDELAKWPRAETTWDNLMLGLRLGEAPRTIVTTTPQPVPLLKRILALKRCETTQGATHENPHLPADFREAVTEMYAGSRLGRQELDGILFDDPEGALWTREMLEMARDSHFHARSADWIHGGSESDCPLMRVVIGVDPPASTTGDACGIVVCGMGAGGIAYVLADLTVSGLRPEGWARKVALAAEQWDAQLVVAEKNQGGDMIESVLAGVDSSLPVRLVSATKGKAARAEPVALRFETGKAKLAGRFPELEDELCAITHAGYEGAGSPDRADAMVWAMTELIKKPREPKVRGF